MLRQLRARVSFIQSRRTKGLFALFITHSCRSALTIVDQNCHPIVFALFIARSSGSTLPHCGSKLPAAIKGTRQFPCDQSTAGVRAPAAPNWPVASPSQSTLLERGWGRGAATKAHSAPSIAGRKIGRGGELSSSTRRRALLVGVEEVLAARCRLWQVAQPLRCAAEAVVMREARCWALSCDFTPAWRWGEARRGELLRKSGCAAFEPSSRQGGLCGEGAARGGDEDVPGMWEQCAELADGTCN